MYGNPNQVLAWANQKLTSETPDINTCLIQAINDFLFHRVSAQLSRTDIGPDGSYAVCQYIVSI